MDIGCTVLVPWRNGADGGGDLDSARALSTRPWICCACDLDFARSLLPAPRLRSGLVIPNLQ